MDGPSEFVALEASPFAGHIGPIEVSVGLPVCFRTTVAPFGSNTMGRAHGGYLNALVDIAAGQGARRLLAEPSTLVTVAAAVQYISAARIGDVIVLKVSLIREATDVVFVDVVGTVADRTIITAAVTFSRRR